MIHFYVIPALDPIVYTAAAKGRNSAVSLHTIVIANTFGILETPSAAGGAAIGGKLVFVTSRIVALLRCGLWTTALITRINPLCFPSRHESAKVGSCMVHCTG